MAAYRRVHDSVTCRLTAKNWDQLWNPTLGNRVWAAFTFYSFIHLFIYFLVYLGRLRGLLTSLLFISTTGNASVPKIIINDTIFFFLNCNQHVGDFKL